MRDDFTAETKNVLSRRVGARCSNPRCRKLTSGPAEQASKAVNLGVAAHIKAASPGGPRYDRSLSSVERTLIENGIWLCQSCAKLVDSDPRRFPVSLLKRWKDRAERSARSQLDGAPAHYETPPSVLELISLVELRAKMIQQAMLRRKDQALEIFEAGKWRTISEDSPMLGTRDLLSEKLRSSRNLGMCVFRLSNDDTPMLESGHPWFRISSRKRLATELNVLAKRFKQLHMFHVAALRRGNYVAAHDVVSEIHALLDEYHALSSPPEIYWQGTLKNRINIRRVLADRIIENHSLYPGKLPRSHQEGMPALLLQHNLVLVEGADDENWKSALSLAGSF